MDSVKILTRAEIEEVLKDLHQRSRRSVNSHANLIVFRLSACCGLRRKEICGLDIGDIAVDGARPCIRIRKAITKGREEKRRARIVPLWWDAGTLADLKLWKAYRGSDLKAPFLCSCHGITFGERFHEFAIAKRWRTALRALGGGRRKQLSIHSGRHSFCSHALLAGRSLAEVRDAAGHRSVHTTSIYLHYLERAQVPDLFDFS